MLLSQLDVLYGSHPSVDNSRIVYDYEIVPLSLILEDIGA